MNVSTAYEIGEEVYVKCYRGKEPQYIKGEIIRFSVYKSKEKYDIRYSVRYIFGNEVFTTDRWESDLIEQDLTGSAMPKLLVIVPCNDGGGKSDINNEKS